MVLAAIRILLAMIMGMSTSMPAASQNPAATPTYGEETLVSPLEEPYEIRVQAGGPIKATQELPAPCVGYIASAPDFDLTYVAGTAPLYIYVESNSDTTLAIQDPGGVWYCSDDDIGLNPVIEIEAPASGEYFMWVGTYRENSAERAMLYVSETPPQPSAN